MSASTDLDSVGRQAERGERAVAAQVLALVDELVAAVVARGGVALAVLVAHDLYHK